MSLRFDIPFESRNGTRCHIEIYDIRYTDTAVWLSVENPNSPAVPAAQPITIEEEDSSDLLDVIRPKTGYLTLVEKQQGYLNSLYPETNDQCQVRVYYDGNLVFFGYIQAQSFENGYTASPRILKFPISSPLGMMETHNFSNISQLADIKLGLCLDECLHEYHDIILPRDLLDDSDEGVNTPLQIGINSRIVCPWNSDYNYGLSSDGSEVSPYAPVSYADLLTMFCNLYGLIAHDYGETVIFTKINYTGVYARMLVGHLAEDTMDITDLPTGDSLLSIEDYFCQANDSSVESLVMPIGKITYDYGQAIEKVSMDLSRSKFVIRDRDPRDNKGTVAVLNPQTNEFTSQFLSIDSNLGNDQNHVAVLGDGEKEFVWIDVITGGSDEVELFSYTFVDIPDGISGARIESGSAAGSLAGDRLKMQVLSGGKYLDEHGDWVDEPTFLEIEFDEHGVCTTYDVGSNGRTITLKFFIFSLDGVHGSSATGAIEKIELETYADPIRRYEIPNDTVKVVRFDNGSKEEVTLDMLIHCANDVTAGLISGAFISRNEYTYLSMSQQRQQRNLLAIQPTDISLLYLYKLTTAGSALKWRLVALNFDPWNDEYKITIHGSPTISYN